MQFFRTWGLALLTLVLRILWWAIRTTFKVVLNVVTVVAVISVFVVAGYWLFFDREPELKTAEESEGRQQEFILTYDLTSLAEDEDGDEFPFFSSDDTSPLAQLNALEQAAQDNQVAGMAIKFSPDAIQPFVTPALLQRVVAALAPMKANSKPVWVYSDNLGVGTTALIPAMASVGDQLWMNEVGEISVNGFFLQMVYFRQFLEDNGIQPFAYSRGTAKSGDDIFAEYQMPEPVKQNLQAVLDDLWQQTLTTLEANTGTDSVTWERLADQMTIVDKTTARFTNLLHNIGSYQEFLEAFKTKLGTERLVGFHSYVARHSYRTEEEDYIVYRDLEERRRDENLDDILEEELEPVLIAALPLKGAINNNQRPRLDNFSPSAVKNWLQCVNENSDIAGAILLIDSPGGSAFASELIYQTLISDDEETDHKPIVAVLQDVAASGGYYVAAAADHIIAQPASLTGSIGVFGGSVSLSQALSERKINLQSLSTGNGEVFGSLLSPPSERGQQLLDEAIDRIYRRFLDRVSQGRGIGVDELEPLAQGQIYTGEMALERRLIDQLGGIPEARAWFRNFYKLSSDQTVVVTNAEKLCDDYQSFDPRWVYDALEARIQRLIVSDFNLPMSATEQALKLLKTEQKMSYLDPRIEPLIRSW